MKKYFEISEVDFLFITGFLSNGLEGDKILFNALNSKWVRYDSSRRTWMYLDGTQWLPGRKDRAFVACENVARVYECAGKQATGKVKIALFKRAYLLRAVSRVNRCLGLVKKNSRVTKNV